MSTEPTVEQKAEALAIAGAERAARLALSEAEKTTELAVNRAVKDALVERELHDHAVHLEQINGSQRDMADSLAAVQTSLAEMSISSQAVARYVSKQSQQRLSKRTLWLMALGGLGGYAGLILALLTLH